MTDRMQGIVGWTALGRAVALCAAISLGGVFAASAQADPQGHWSCFTTAVHVDGATDPVIANPNPAPCQNDSQSASATGTVKASPGSAAATSVSVSTSAVLHSPPQVGDKASGQGTAQSVTIVSGNTVIKADGLSTQASVTCTATGSTATNTTGSFTLSGTASVTGLSINGNQVPITGGPQTIPTPAGTLYIDAAYQPVSFAVYQRALWLQTSSGDIIADEAAVAGVGQPCQDGPPPPPPPPPTPGFGCYASAIQAGPLRPLVANPFIGPCSTQHASGTSASLDNNVVTASAPYANTLAHPNPLPAFTALTPYPTGTYVAANAGAGSVKIGLDAFPITANSVGSSTTAWCSAPGTQSLSSTSQVDGLTLAGGPMPDSTTPTDITIPDGVGTLHLNWIFQNSVFVERRALWLETFLGQDVIIGDSLAGSNSNPC